MSVLGATSELIKGVKRLPRRIFGTRNDRLLKQYNRHVAPIGAFEEELRGDFDAAFARRLGDTALADLPDEQRPAAEQALCVELSADLRERGTQRVREMSWENSARSLRDLYLRLLP